MMLTLLTGLPVTTTAALPTMAQPRRFTFSDTKEHSMHRMILAAAAATLTLTAASAGLAQARVTVDCAPGQRSCVQQDARWCLLARRGKQSRPATVIESMKTVSYRARTCGSPNRWQTSSKCAPL